MLWKEPVKLDKVVKNAPERGDLVLEQASMGRKYALDNALHPVSRRWVPPRFNHPWKPKNNPCCDKDYSKNDYSEGDISKLSTCTVLVTLSCSLVYG